MALRDREGVFDFDRDSDTVLVGDAVCDAVLLTVAVRVIVALEDADAVCDAVLLNEGDSVEGTEGVVDGVRSSDELKDGYGDSDGLAVEVSVIDAVFVHDGY